MHTIQKLFFSRYEKYFTFFLFIYKTIKVATNNPMFQYIFTFKTTQILSFFIEKYYSSPRITYKSSEIFFQFFEDVLTFQILEGSPHIIVIFSLLILFQNTKTLSIVFFLNLYYTFITYDGRKSNEQRAKSNKQRAKSNEQNVQH